MQTHSSGQSMSVLCTSWKHNSYIGGHFRSFTVTAEATSGQLRCRPKTFLFQKSYPDIILWHSSAGTVIRPCSVVCHLCHSRTEVNFDWQHSNALWDVLTSAVVIKWDGSEVRFTNIHMSVPKFRSPKYRVYTHVVRVGVYMCVCMCMFVYMFHSVLFVC